MVFLAGPGSQYKMVFTLFIIGCQGVSETVVLIVNLGVINVAQSW